MRGLRYQHRRDCELLTPYGTVHLDGEGNVTNLSELNPADLLTIPGMVDTEVFGETEVKPGPAKASAPPTAQAPQGATDEQYWGLIKELTEGRKNLNSEGYVQMEVLTPAIRAKGWPPISGTRRLKITDEGREREKAATSERQK